MKKTIEEVGIVNPTGEATTMHTVDATSPALAFQANGVTWRRPHLVVLRAELRAYDVLLWSEIADRDTGELRAQAFTVGYETLGILAPTPTQTRQLLRDAYLKLVCHELDELLRIDNHWVDPHAGDATDHGELFE